MHTFNSSTVQDLLLQEVLVQKGHCLTRHSLWEKLILLLFLMYLILIVLFFHVFSKLVTSLVSLTIFFFYFL